VATLPRQLRIDRPLNAYVTCGLLSTAIVFATGCLLLLASFVIRDVGRDLDLVAFVSNGTRFWLATSAIGLPVACPFVLVATWFGSRMRIESAIYYSVAGGSVMFALLLLLLGLPGKPEPGDFGMILSLLWPLCLGCGISWGACWWFLHRRWKATKAGQRKAA